MSTMPATLTDRRLIPHAILAIISALALSVGGALACVLPLPDGEHEYNAPGFVVRHAWVKFALLATRPLRADLSRAEEDARVARFFELNALIDAAERTAGDPASAPADAAAAGSRAGELRRERAALENTVELILEGRLTAVIKESGLTRRAGRDVVWPPVNIEFEEPPSVLVTSPRSEIRKDGESLLKSGLPIERIQEIEARAEAGGETSALVVEIGGIATYPAIIPPSSNYRFVLEDIAHEWLHHYLYFAPLGRRYYDSGDLTTLNETVANMAGAELGAALLQDYPLAGTPAATATPPRPRPTHGFDFTVEMRALRREVEALLAAGRIEDAERLMDERRADFAVQGYYIRRLNQAYFAFHGSYADTPGSIDPIGPKLARLRELSPSIEAFIEMAREFRSADDLDRALTEPR